MGFHRALLRQAIAVSAIAMIASCADSNSKTDLLPGPPFIMQVRMDEAYVATDGSKATRRIFGFGVHPLAAATDEHPVTSAIAGVATSGIHFRIIMSKLLLGNTLEEIACNAPVGPDGIWAKVPVGATPDDIARCATTKDTQVLAQTCPGPFATCLCQLDQGCLVGTVPVAKGLPVGVKDENQDGAADEHRFIPDSVGLTCDSIKVPIDLAASYWNPSGFQQPPAMFGFEQLGPAIVLQPVKMVGNQSFAILPTNTNCQLNISPDVTDKENRNICAPTVPAGCTNMASCVNLDKPCNPGDVSAFQFKTEPLNLQLQGISEGMTGVSRTDDLIAQTDDGVILDPSTIGNVTITQNGAPFTTFTTMADNPPQTFRIHPTTPFAANAMITFTFTTNIADAFGRPLPAVITIHFTTGA